MCERVVVNVRLDGLNQVRKRLADGTLKIYYYHRATGQRLKGEKNSAEFLASYVAAEKSIRDRLAGTFDGLIRDYTNSTEFQHLLAASTQAEYRRMMTAAEKEFGDMPLPALDDVRVKKELLNWRERVSRNSGKREADHRLSAISAMLTWAVDRGKITVNHLRGFKRLYHSDRSEIIWLREHIEAFMKVASIEMQRAMIMALHTGQREGDLLRASLVSLRQRMDQTAPGQGAPPQYSWSTC